MKTSHYSYLTMIGHICSDINQGALPALLPFLVVAHGVSYTAAAGLMFASSLVSSVVQPLFGYLGDKSSRPWLMALGIFLAGTGVGLIGFLPEYWMMFLSAMVAGVGSALFHPEGGRIANLVADPAKKGTGMGIFAVGGNIGFAVGPIIATLGLTKFGLRGTGVLFIPATVMALLILTQVPTLRRLTNEIQSQNASKRLDNQVKDDWVGFTKLSLVVTCRSICYSSLITFVPLYWMSVLLQSEEVGNMQLTLFSVVGAVATILGGRLADRMGFRRVVRIFGVAMVPLLLLFLQMGNPLAASALLIPVAVCVNAPYSTMIAMGQAFVPNRLGFASGITLGLAVSIGGMVSPMIGRAGDLYGLSTGLYIVVGFAVLGMLFSFITPDPKR